jgi:Zn-dependent peptidase ImmA (M78 family)
VSDKIVKVIDAFAKAKAVNHYYWMHTDGDEATNGVVSVENIQKIISLMTGVEIFKEEVDVASDFHRALIERYDGGKKAYIYVMAAERDDWKRFATVKELCHALIDAGEDFQPDPCVTIHGVKDGAALFDEGSIPEKDSENLAEIIAMELLYPLELRRADREEMRRGATLDDVARQRRVPPKYISLGTSDPWLEFCETVWRALADVSPQNLNHLL